MALLSRVPIQTEGELCLDEREINIPGEQWADIAALADRRRCLPRAGLAKVASLRKTQSQRAGHLVDVG
jgi:hypothetical protein